ncbi:hypothetical protein [Nocardia sp. NPDC004711]
MDRPLWRRRRTQDISRTTSRPLDAEYRAPVTNFVIYDQAQVLTETVSAELTIT